MLKLNFKKKTIFALAVLFSIGTTGVTFASIPMTVIIEPTIDDSLEISSEPIQPSIGSFDSTIEPTIDTSLEISSGNFLGISDGGQIPTNTESLIFNSESVTGINGGTPVSTTVIPTSTQVLGISEDSDGDGFAPFNGDCDDSDATIFPGALEIIDDGIDQDCDGNDLILSEAISYLQNLVESKELSNNVEKSLLGPLKQASKIANDGNPDNDSATCDKLSEFITNVNDKESSGKLDSSLADDLEADALAIKDSIGCPLA